MTRQCFQCRRGSLKVMSRSHSNRATIRRQYVNLQSRWMNGKRISLCTSCIKTNKKKAEAGVNLVHQPKSRA